MRALGSPDPLAIPTDLSDAASIEAAFATIGERWGGVVNSLVNAVGPNSQGNVEQVTDEAWFAAMELGAFERGALRPCRASRCCAPPSGDASSTCRRTPRSGRPQA